MWVRIGDLPTESTFLQRVRHQELSAVSSEELVKKLNTLKASAWDPHSLRWHFSGHGSQVGATTETEYARLAEAVLNNPTRIFSEIYVDPRTINQYGLSRLLPSEREDRIKEVVTNLPRSWIFVDEWTGRVVVVSDTGRILTLYAHTVPQGIATFIRNRLLSEGVEILIGSEANDGDQDAQSIE